MQKLKVIKVTYLLFFLSGCSKDFWCTGCPLTIQDLEYPRTQLTFIAEGQSTDIVLKPAGKCQEVSYNGYLWGIWCIPGKLRIGVKYSGSSPSSDKNSPFEIYSGGWTSPTIYTDYYKFEAGKIYSVKVLTKVVYDEGVDEPRRMNRQRRIKAYVDGQPRIMYRGLIKDIKYIMELRRYTSRPIK